MTNTFINIYYVAELYSGGGETEYSEAFLTKEEAERLLYKKVVEYSIEIGESIKLEYDYLYTVGMYSFWIESKCLPIK